MIKIENLVKKFGDKKVIDDISFKVSKGEIFGIVGKSGVGKSTVLRCINGLEEPTSGDVFVLDKNIALLKENEKRQIAKEIAMVFQTFNLLNQKTAFENVSLPMEIWGYDKKYIKERAKELLNLVGLKGKENQKPRTLSGGEKQRVGIARALSLDPKILLSDEATSALDPKTTKEILKLLKDINEQLGITIIVVTHEMEVVKEICERVCIMEAGKILDMGNVDDLFLKPKSPLKTLLGEDEFSLLPEGNNIEIFFTKEYSKEAIITKMAKSLDVDFSIIGGKLEKFGDNTLGSLIINVKDKDKQNILNYLKKIDILWEEK